MAIVLQPLCETEQIATTVQPETDKAAIKPPLNDHEIIRVHYGINPTELINTTN